MYLRIIKKLGFIGNTHNICKGIIIGITGIGGIGEITKIRGIGGITGCSEAYQEWASKKFI